MEHADSFADAIPVKKPRTFTLGRLLAGRLLPHVVLVLYAVVALFPVLLIVSNSFKDRRDIFLKPYTPPVWVVSEDDGLQIANSGTLSGYREVFERADVVRYFTNSLRVTVASLFLILLVGSMVSHAITEYQFMGNRLLFLYLVVGIMIPVRLSTVSLIRILDSLGLYDSLTGLTLVYTATGIPIGVFIMTTAMRDVPGELKDAARIDGASEYRILFQIVLPLLRGALATVMIFNMITIWNDLWFPLTLAPSEPVRTVTLGASAFVGQYRTDWSALLAALTLAMLPAVAMYIVFSRQFIRGLMSGAVKS